MNEGTETKISAYMTFLAEEEEKMQTLASVLLFIHRPSSWRTEQQNDKQQMV